MRTIIIYFFCLFILSGCKKLVEAPSPITRLVTESVFDQSSTATAAQTSIYSNMVTKGFSEGLEINLGWSSDELICYTPTQYQQDLYKNNLSSLNDANSLGYLWSGIYNYIYQANAIIEGLQKYNDITNATSKQLIGEAKFTRAFFYFYLVNLYGDVPLVTSTDYNINNNLSRKPKSEVYQQMITDLKDAQNLLNNNFVDASDTVTTVDRVRPTKAAANALLARIYLYTGDFGNAETQASLVIGNTLFSLVPDLNKVFLKNSSETIWQLMPPPTTYALQDGTVFILLTTPTQCSISNQLLNAFEKGDARRSAWVDSIIVSGKTYFFSYKYKAGKTSTTQSEYNMVLRLAEMYLIRAEARAQQDKVNEALLDINTIRSRAKLSPYSGQTDKASILAAILHERQAELFTEWGNRWFDLKRTGNIDQVMSSVTPQKGGGNWKNYQQLYPIPLTDIQNNLNLTQTPGY